MNVSYSGSISFSIWVVIVVAVILVVAAFWIGYMIGSAKAGQRMAKYLEDREHRRLIRMQRYKPARGARYQGYTSWRRNDRKYNKALKAPTRLRK